MKQCHIVFDGGKNLWKCVIRYGAVRGKTFFVDSTEEFYNVDYQVVLSWMLERMRNRV